MRGSFHGQDLRTHPPQDLTAPTFSFIRTCRKGAVGFFYSFLLGRKDYKNNIV